MYVARNKFVEVLYIYDDSRIGIKLNNFELLLLKSLAYSGTVHLFIYVVQSLSWYMI